MEIGERWMKWAVMEGGAKVVKRMTMKFAGISGQSMAGAFTFTMMDGICQLIGGYLGGKLRGQPIMVTPGQILGGILFGIIATGMTVLGVLAFLYPDADAGAITFLVTMSIIPGALIDWWFFGHPLNARQCLGIFAYLLSGYAILDFPGIERLVNLPTWVWLGLAIAFLGAVNEAITQAVRKMDPLVNNFWIGLTTIICCTSGLYVIGGWDFLRVATVAFWFVALIAGIDTLGMISFKLLSYKGGGSIALKKLIMQGTHLVGAVIFGILIYAEPITIGKFFGALGFFVAFSLMDKGTWEYMSTFFLSPAIERR